MSATPPSTLEGTETPNPFEVLWDRYRSLIIVIVSAVLLAVAGKAVWTQIDQGKQSEKWSKFVASIGLSETYTDITKGGMGHPEALKDFELATLESGLAEADENQKPYFHLAIARKAILEENWDRAEQALDSLEKDFPKHNLVTVSKQAVQALDETKLEKDEERTAPIFVDPAEGSVVSLMRAEIAAAKQFKEPASYAKPEIPADAKKIKFTFGDTGSFTVALMGGATKHHEKLLELAAKDEGAYFKGIAVDEVVRPTDRARFQAMSFHFGFQSTKDDDRTTWTTTEPSEHEMDFEKDGLSNYEGTFCARTGADDKSCPDRFWVQVDEDANLDGTRVILGYVIEGMDVLRTIGDAGLSAAEEDAGRGRPIENIRVTAVEIL